MDFYAELELPGLGKIDRLIKINDPLAELEFPLATCICLTRPLRDIAEAAGVNFKRYKFIQRGMYPSEWGFKEVDKKGRAIPYIKAFKVLYELGEII